jgi:hypothetical protein
MQSAQPMGQSFTPSLSAVGFVRLFFADLNRGNGLGGTVYVNLRSGSISGTVLGATPAIAMADSFGGFTDFYFPSTVSVVPGTKYYFETVFQSGDPNFGIVAYNSYFYSGGEAIFSGTPSPGFDLWFREGIVVPEPSTIGLGIFGAVMFFFVGRKRMQQ